MRCGCGATMELVSETTARCSAGCQVFDEWVDHLPDNATLEQTLKGFPAYTLVKLFAAMGRLP